LVSHCFGKAVAGRVAINTDDLDQPSRQTRHSEPDLSFTTLADHTDVYKYSFFLRTIRDWNSFDTAVKGDAYCWIFAEELKKKDIPCC